MVRGQVGRVDGAGGNPRNVWDAEVRKEPGRAAQEADLVRGAGVAAPHHDPEVARPRVDYFSGGSLEWLERIEWVEGSPRCVGAASHVSPTFPWVSGRSP